MRLCPQPCKRIQRYQLSALMTEGELIFVGVTLTGETQSLAGELTVACVEASQRYLQLAFLDWQGPMPKERRHIVFEQLFHDAQPAA